MSTERMLTGNRFEAFYSLNQRFADIVDRKRRGILMMLTLDDVEALERRMVATARSLKASPAKPFNVTYSRTHGKLVGLSYEDAVELHDLAETLTKILVPNLGEAPDALA